MSRPSAHGQTGPPLPVDSPDRRDGLVYVMPPRVDLAVEVALATGRPLLLRGEPGSGKSSLAAYVARRRDWRYYEHVVTSRTKADDLLWTYDHVRRLSDAQVRERGETLHDAQYVTPGPLWWAYDPRSAAGGPQGVRRRAEPWAEVNAGRDPRHAVVLIDEIDKADPDVPNSLLVPLGSHRFTVSDTGETVSKETAGTGHARTAPGPVGGDEDGAAAPAGQHLIVITTNEERELPQAFLRRCVVVALDEPDPEGLVEIAGAHFRCYHGAFTPDEEHLARELAVELDRARTEARKLAMRAPSTAEFLDALRACKSLGIGVRDPRWQQVKSLTLVKPQQPEA